MADDELVPASRRAFARAWESLPREHGFEPLTVEGALPASLRGVFYRNGPALFALYGRRYLHWHDGDGAVTAVRLDGAGAAGAVRVTESPELKEERAAQSPLYSSGHTPASNWLRRLGGRTKNAANIHVLPWRDDLYALSEGFAPLALYPATLLPLVPSPLDPVLQGPLHAHTRVDPRDGTAYGFGVSHGLRSTLDLYAFPPQGPARCLGQLPLAEASARVHDFALTETHFVFFLHPLHADVVPSLLGLRVAAETVAWRPAQGTEVLLVPRADPTGPGCVRFTTEAFFHQHYGNAFTRDDGRVEVSLCKLPRFEPDDGLLASIVHGDAFVSDYHGQLYTAVIDPQAERVDFERVTDFDCELPAVAPGRVGRRNRFLWVVETHRDRDLLTRVDLESGACLRPPLPETWFPGEVTLVPRSGPDGAPDDAWALSLVYDSQGHRSGLVVLDASRFDAPPVATAWFDHHIPPPLHGAFVPAPSGDPVG